MDTCDPFDWNGFSCGHGNFPTQRTACYIFHTDMVFPLKHMNCIVRLIACFYKWINTTCMRTYVNRQIVLLGEPSGAVTASERFLSTVSSWNLKKGYDCDIASRIDAEHPPTLNASATVLHIWTFYGIDNKFVESLVQVSDHAFCGLPVVWVCICCAHFSSCEIMVD